MTEVFRLRLLGPVVVKRDDTVVDDFESWKALALLCYVAVQDKSLTRSHLADLFWPTKSERRGRANLSRVLHNIRSLLPDILDTDRQSVAVDRSSDSWIDTAAFDELVRKGDPASLADAAALYRGEFMGNVTADDCPDVEIWLAVERERWRQRVVQVLDSLVVHHSRRGEYEDGLRYTARILELERWREEAHRQRMQLLALSGQRSAALAQYEVCCQVLEDELGVEPEPTTRELYERIRDADLRATTVDTDHASTSSSATISLGFPSHTSEEALLPFLGRGDEYTWLVQQWKTSRQGNGKFTLIEGESGRGKTRLVNEVLRYVSQSGALVLQGQCYTFGAEIPYQSIVPILRIALEHKFDLGDVWLAELATLLPEINEHNADLPNPLATSTEAARQRLFEAVARLLLAVLRHQQAVVVFLDDLHLADQATLELLQYLFYRTAGAPLWFLGTYRPEEIVADHPLNILRRALLRDRRLALLHLEALDVQTITQLAHSLEGLGDAEREQLVEYLVRESEGNAFILTQLLHDLTERDILTMTDDRWSLDLETFGAQRSADAGTSAVPLSVQEVVLSRCDRVSRLARRLLELAAVIGQHLDLKVLREAAAADIDVAETLEELVDRRLLTFHPSTAEYEFSHGVIHSVVYDRLSFARRQQLHASVAAALERLYAGENEQVVERLATHHLKGGNDEQALLYVQQAAERAEQMYAWETAIQQYTRILDLLSEDDLEERYRVLARREWAYNIIADHHAQDTDLQRLQALADRLNDDVRRAEVFCRKTKLALRRGHFAAGIEMAEQATDLAEDTDRVDVVAESLRLGALCWHNHGDYEQAQEWGQRALTLYEAEGNRQGRTLALNTLGVLSRKQGYLREAQYYMEEAVAEWRDIGDVWRLATGLSTLSILYYEIGDVERALEAQREVRELAPQTGDLHLEASSLNSLGLIYHAHGRFADAMEVFQTALETSRTADAPKIEAAVLLSQAHTLLELERVDEAEENYRRSLEIQDAIGSPVLRAETLNGLADCHLTRGNAQDALDVLNEAEDLYASSALPGISETLVRQAEAHVARDDIDKAGEVVRRFVDVVEHSDSRERPSEKTWQRAKRAVAAYGDEVLLEKVEALANGHVHQPA